MKRPLLIIGIFLLLGAVVNVAVVLACTAWAVYPCAEGTTETTVWPRPVPEGWPTPFETHAGSAFGYTRVVCLSAVSWESEGGDRLQYQQILSRWGWPLRSLEMEERLVVDLEAGSLLSYQFARFRPLWPGLAVSTLFYAGLLWLLIPGPFALRRFLRVRRGLCPKCAYPMGESAVCTECGGALLPGRPLRD